VLETANADIADQTTLVAQDLNALQLLVGAPVDPALLPTSIEDAGAKLREVPAGLDSTILLRRPDVIEAEYQLKAANAEIGCSARGAIPENLADQHPGLRFDGARRAVHRQRLHLAGGCDRRLSDLQRRGRPPPTSI
jgi:hypothetical protein